MTKIELRMIQTTEMSKEFLQGMLSRMDNSYYKYGPLREAFPHRINALKTMEQCIKAYHNDGNSEHLIDAANYLMIEFIVPSKPDVAYVPTDSSVGRMWHGEVDPSERENKL